MVFKKILEYPWSIFVLLQMSLKINAFDASQGYLSQQYLNAITAYGPGLGVFAPYTYVDVSYNDIPYIGKIPSLGKEGTSSHLGISPFYPEGGFPGIAAPTLYRANPLPPHVPEPVDVVAVPLDEEALHGEPLFPKELMLPYEKQMAEKEANAKQASVRNPFGGENTEEALLWPSRSEYESSLRHSNTKGKKGERKGRGKSTSSSSLPKNPF